MAKFRKRVNRIKGKRWAKGQSSSSNPSTQKYREAAKSRFFEPITGPSMLTKEAIEKHDAKSFSKDGTSIADDLESFGGKTFKTFDTFASDWSACSNQSFSKLIKNFKSDCAIHKDMLAVLAAVTEVIKENGGNETSTEYFGALITSLDSDGNTDETVAAILNLLSMGIKSVPKNVLQAKFSESSSILIKTLARFSETEKTSVLRAILGCLSVLLRAQEAAAWGNSYTLQVLDLILTFICFSKPKVRKAAQHGITVIVRGSSISQGALSHIGQHCIKLIESVTTGSITITLHTFTLLKDIMHTFPKKELKECCESVLKVMTMNNVLLISCGLQVLHGMFLGRPMALTGARAARLINALYDYQPPVNDSQLVQAWLAVLHQGYLFLAQSDLTLCIVNCPKLFTTCTPLYLTNKPETMTAATHALQAVITDCIGPASRSDCLNRHSQEISKVVLILQDCLAYHYHGAWTHVLHLIAALFKASGDTCTSMLLPCVKGLIELRDSDQFLNINELENAVGVAISSMGPEAILKAVPFQINVNDKKGEFKRSWLLPVLKDNIKGSSLKVFINEFLPLATTCKNEAERFKSENDQIRALSYDLLQTQIWSLLPSFATMPTDIALSFPVIAKALGGVLNSRKDLRTIVLSTLRKLITFSVENNREEDLATMKKFAKNYLPILFVIYTTKVKGSDEEGARLASYETIKVYLKIANQELTKELYDRAFLKLENKETVEFVRDCVLDLLKALLPYQSRENVKKLYDMVVGKLSNTSDHREQKKYYKLIEEICTSESEALSEFLNEHLEQIRALLVESLSKTAPSSKAARLRCLLELLKRVDDPLTLAIRILPETVLCVKDINHKCRDTAFKILEYISKNLRLDDYLHVLLAGLAGSPSLITCSLLALSAVVFHVREQLLEDVEHQLLYNVGLLAVCNTREIVSAALSFIKVYIQSFPRIKVGQFLPDLMKILSGMTEDCKRHNRTKTRDILSRLCRWFGADELMTHIPAGDDVLRVRVRNLGKLHNRKQRLREASKASSVSPTTTTFSAPSRHKSIEEILAESDSDIDMDADDDKDSKDPKNKKKGKVWITEDVDDIVDFTDTKTTQKITATKPGTFAAMLEKKQNKKKSEFKTAPDGRLIITDDMDEDDDDENEGRKKKKKSVIPGLDDSDDDYEMSDDDVLTTATSAVGGRKRALSVSSMGTTVQPNKYQAGGKGIHRPVKRPSSIASSRRSMKSRNSSIPSVKTGNEYKAKKAKGDIKKKGLPDPYAYIPLRRDALNKRKRIKNMTNLKKILQSAKQGVKIGQKNRRFLKKT